MELMTKEIAEQLITAWNATQEREADLASVTDTLEDAYDRPVVVKYFTPDGNATWWIVDGEHEEDGDWRLFGLCDLGLGFPELGYIQLSELRQLRGNCGLPIERDLHWSGTLRDARRRAGIAA